MEGVQSGEILISDRMFVWDLYNRAVLRVYEPWCAEGVSWVNGYERRRAEAVVEKARKNLESLAQDMQRAPEPKVARWNLDAA
ncbi:hypothetical protein ABZ801_25880 [Actinomadura sp. NPDC047616]|uniref:hypothetical protein n=1 Tax=Actinomadura sp. NPDC047616 TaxID=3155914 RepID=UPI00340BA250